MGKYGNVLASRIGKKYTIALHPQYEFILDLFCSWLYFRAGVRLLFLLPISE
jgi:hypothetical protein